MQVPQRRPGGLAAGVAADHAATLLPAALAIDLVDVRAVLGHAHPAAVAAAESAAMAAGVMATRAPWVSASVLEWATVMRPLPLSQRTTSPHVNVAALERRRPD